MSDFGPRIRRLFEEIAPPLDLDATLVRAETSRRPAWVPVSAAVLGLVALTVAVAVLLSGPDDDGVAVSTTEPVASSTTSSTTPPVAEPGGLVHFGEHGVTIIPADGAAFTLTGDSYFEGVGRVLPDGLGGIVFTHAITPPPWPPGSIMWLAAGATEPVVLVAPSGQGPAAEAAPYAMVDTLDGPALVYLDWEYPEGMVRLQPLDPGAAPTDLWPVSDTARLHWVSAGGGRVLVDLRDPVCRLVLLDTAGAVIPSAFTADPCDGTAFAYRLTADGEEVWYARRIPSPVLGVARLDGSAPPAEVDIDAPTRLEFDGVDTAVVATDSGGRLRVTRTADGFEVTPIDLSSGPVGVPYRGFLSLTADATLGSGSTDYPCTDRIPPLPDQPLPDAVAEARRRIHAAVEACDWATLAALAGQGESFFWDQAFSVPPLPYWVDAMRRGGDILGDIATVLTLPAGSAADGDGNITWVWPAVAGLHDAATDADWQALLPLYPQEVIDRHRASEYGYVGLFALWIADDGTWVAAANLHP